MTDVCSQHVCLLKHVCLYHRHALHKQQCKFLNTYILQAQDHQATPVHAETTVLANHLKNEGFKVISLHPGEVDTVMWKYLSDNVFTEGTKSSAGYRQPQMSPQQSVQAMLKVVTNLKMQDSGRFFLYDGSEVPW